MGTDVRLKLKNLEIKGDMSMAHLGRKYPFQQNDGTIEKDANKLWPEINRIEQEIRAKLAFHIGYTASSIEEAQTMLQGIDQDISGWVEELVQYGRKILLANILHDSAGFLYLEDC